MLRNNSSDPYTVAMLHDRVVDNFGKPDIAVVPAIAINSTSMRESIADKDPLGSGSSDSGC